MATADVALNSYIDNMLSESGTSVSDSLIMSGMEDCIRKFFIFRPQELPNFEAMVEITSVPHRLQLVYPSLKVYSGNKSLTRTIDKNDIADRYSLLNDRGATEYYYVIGRDLYIYPFTTGKAYSVRSIVYSVNRGALTWPAVYNYPLALYCVYSILFARYVEDMNTIVSQCNTRSGNVVPSVPAPTLPTITHSELPRLTNDDVELAQAEMESVKIYLEEFSTKHQATLSSIQASIQAYTASVGSDSVFVEKIRSHTENAKSSYALMMNAYQQYTDYFTSGAKK